MCEQAAFIDNFTQQSIGQLSNYRGKLTRKGQQPVCTGGRHAPKSLIGEWEPPDRKGTPRLTNMTGSLSCIILVKIAQLWWVRGWQVKIVTRQTNVISRCTSCVFRKMRIQKKFPYFASTAGLTWTQLASIIVISLNLVEQPGSIVTFQDILLAG